jgi:hypothetical protein
MATSHAYEVQIKRNDESIYTLAKDLFFCTIQWKSGSLSATLMS